MTANVVLSILPPAQALPFARLSADLLRRVAGNTLYVDCNAVSPTTLEAIESTVTHAGSSFVDGCIIGSPPKAQSPPPRLYVAGERADEVQRLREFGLDVRRLAGPVGTASALKMAYGGITKGITAVASAMILGACRAGVAESLNRELRDSEPQLYASLAHRIIDMLPKAYRWVAEMQEVGEFLSADAASAQIYEGAAQLYQRLASDLVEDAEETASLKSFFETGSAEPFA